MHAAKLWTSVLVAGILAAAAPANASCPLRSSGETHVFAAGLCLVVNTFGAEQAGVSPTLVVVVHGDISDGGAATYHAAFGRTLARPGVVVVALLRPGYTDANGRKSAGSTLGRGDNYTADTVAAVGGAIAALKRHHGAGRVIYVGHSGGAAIGGVVIGRRPGLVDAALLISCPCDLDAWLHARRRPPWMRSLSPSDHAHRIASTTEVVAISGTRDDNTFPWLAQHYVERLQRRGIRARFVPVEGAGHGFSTLKDAAAAEVERMLVP